ncbi:UvrABC system protein C [Clarias magur]|uniref:UvrABC system protein C n=1 Tax=Clarias magur TaxID=1594786 RepID=A0A8J4XAT3_CLAMG|nr:UvrABC system protein C [Clarias magur]
MVDLYPSLSWEDYGQGSTWLSTDSKRLAVASYLKDNRCYNCIISNDLETLPHVPGVCSLYDSYGQVGFIGTK